MENQKVLLKAKSTGDIYEYLGPQTYKNLSTGQQGTIDDEIVARVLVIPITLNEMQLKNPFLSEMISKMGLKMERGG